MQDRTRVQRQKSGVVRVPIAELFGENRTNITGYPKLSGIPLGKTIRAVVPPDSPLPLKVNVPRKS